MKYGFRLSEFSRAIRTAAYYVNGIHSVIASTIMGICVSRMNTPAIKDHHQRHHHPDGVAGLKPEEIDHDPFHANPNGVVSSLPFIELAGVSEEEDLYNVMQMKLLES